MRIYLLIITVLICVSCSDKKKVEVRDGQGRLTATYHVLKDDTSVMHGLYQTYNTEGIVIESYHLDMGQLSGSRELYDDSGQLILRETYKNGLFNGPYISYHPSGLISEEGVFEQNLMVGVWKYYYDSTGNALKEEIQYTNNMENGPYKEYYSTGSLKAEGVYKDELDDGPFRSYHMNGQLMLEGTFSSGRREGLFREYDVDGNLIREQLYERGFKVDPEVP